VSIRLFLKTLQILQSRGPCKVNFQCLFDIISGTEGWGWYQRRHGDFWRTWSSRTKGQN